MDKYVLGVQGGITAAFAWLSVKLGSLGPALMCLLALEALDFVSGMVASKREAVEHPDDPTYGWSSKKGAKGIEKKVGYLLVIASALVLDYLIVHVASQIGINATARGLFGTLTTVWYILNELLSIVENAGRMGAPVPEWLSKYIATLKAKIDNQAGEDIHDQQ